jgi:hypothetical protein
MQCLAKLAHWTGLNSGTQACLAKLAHWTGLNSGTQAVRSYIANGKWTADWNEVKAACVDHGCYDGANFSQAMNKGKGGVFKNVAVGSNVEISASGQTDVKNLMASLVQDATK